MQVVLARDVSKKRAEVCAPQSCVPFLPTSNPLLPRQGALWIASLRTQ